MSNTFAIFTDSSSDLTSEQCEQHDLICLNLSVELAGETLAPNYNLDEFYQKMTPKSPAKTSAINVYTFTVSFRQVLSQGSDILYLGISSTLSSTFENSQIAAAELAQEFPERKIICIDTLSVAPGLGLLVRLADSMRQQGKSLDETVDFITKQREHVAHWFSVDEFNYLKSGGRISGAEATIADMLNIRPILHFSASGKLTSKQKARGNQNMLKKLAEIACSTCIYPTFVIAHAKAEDKAEQLTKYILKLQANAQIEHARIGPVIGAHTGPSVIAIFFLSNNR